ncbi:uncharacterized protein EI90DRAFT_3155984 [Cantharellus anzutake]|uniref:uncharacterized protein n=1 Tax=Cantharellus anzutake TaxID=1750568 RepID=UPI00190445F4|nr:uncharacterized protein EI90DRAFT_3155984 [Cantharellus anzutake]KAF8327898.1 hypothetical protein EI90DRAFT_3155984 [Cantharellus anzutake]
MSPTIVPAPLAGTQDEWSDEDFDLPEGDSILQHIQPRDSEDAGAGRLALHRPSRPTALRMSTGPEEEDEIEDWDLEGDVLSSSTPGLNAVISSTFTQPVVKLGSGSSQVIKEDVEDWDADLGLGATIKAGTSARSTSVLLSAELGDNDDSNTSTIKVSKITLPAPTAKAPLPSPSRTTFADDGDDMEDAFALPDDLSHLSLKPLVHQSSKSTIGEWSSDSMLSDVPSSFGFHDKTASESPTSLPDSEVNTDEEAEVEGLVLPDSFLPRDLARMLEKKKKGQAPPPTKKKLPFPCEDDDPESGLAIQDDSELSPSRLRKGGLSPKVRRIAKTFPSIRSSPTPLPSSTARSQPHITVIKPASHQSSLIAPKLTARDARSPSPIPARPASETRMAPKPSSTNLARQPSSSTLPRRPKDINIISRTKTLSPPPWNPSIHPPLSHSHSMLSILRGGPPSPQRSKLLKHQKSTSGLLNSPSTSTFPHPDTPNSPSRKGLSRKASLSSLLDSQPSTQPVHEDKHERHDSISSRSTSRQSTLGTASLQTRGTVGHVGGASYKQPTASSRARGIRTTETGVVGSDREKGLFQMFTTRPTTPSTSASILRLTMPTSSSRAKMKEKARVPVSSIFPQSAASSSSSSSGVAPSSVIAPGSSSSTPISRQSSVSPVQMMRPSGTRSPMQMTISSAARIIRRPKTARTYGDGTELDGIEDLVVEKEKESKFRVIPKAVGTLKDKKRPSTSAKTIPRKSGPSQASSAAPLEKGAVKRPPSSLDVGEPPHSAGVASISRQKSRADLGVTSPGSNVPPPLLAPAPTSGAYAAMKRARTKSGAQKKPTLIRNLSGVGSPKAHHARPALITHLTGSSVGGVGSPTGFLGHNTRIVGNMIFDPTKMCWINRNAKDEIDPFSGMSDEDDNEATWGKSKGATITIRTYRTSAPTAGTPLETVAGSPARSSVAATNRSSMAFTTTSESDTESVEAVSLAGSVIGGSPPRRFERGASTSPIPDVDETMAELCRQAEERHRREIRGWYPPSSRRNRRATQEDDDVEVDRSYLFEIRELATRKYPA